MKKNKNRKKSQRKTIAINLDTIPNILKFPEQEKFVKDLWHQKLEQDLDNRISRYRDLPAFVVEIRGKNDYYVKLLHEARELYVEGKFYSCIAMCGVTSERIAKDILKRAVLIRKLEKTKAPNFFHQLDRIPMDVVRELIIDGGMVDKSIRDDFKELANLRDKCVHARMIVSENDAQKAIKYLHNIIDETVSVFKKYKIQKGKLVPK